MIDGVNLVRSQGFNISLKLVGITKNKLSSKILEKINSIDPKNKYITAEEFCDHDDLPKLIDDSDIFIFASTCENMPNTLIEGMSMQVPIICSNYGPMPEVLGDGGLYFDPEKPLELANCLLKLIKDPKLAYNLALRSKYLSNRFSWEKCSDETFSLLKKINIKYSIKL